MQNIHRKQRVSTLLAIASISLLLAGCGGGEEAASAGAAQAAVPEVASGATGSAPAANGAPILGGQPVVVIVAGRGYSFQLASSDPDGDALTFKASGLPGWATVDASTGRISGTPAASDVGTSGRILITASDGAATSALPEFSIEVTQAGANTGSVSLSWMPPTQNEDGSPLVNLAGYTVYYGNDEAAMTTAIQVNNAGITSYLVADLAAGSYYFSVKSYNSSGGESSASGIVSKIII